MGNFKDHFFQYHHFIEEETEELEDSGPTTRLQGSVTIQDHPALLTPAANSGGSQTTLRFDNLLERLTELTESYYTHGYGLLQRKDTDKI